MDYTELELVNHTIGILDAVLDKNQSEEVKMMIMAAQHKLDLLKEKLEIL